jgi:hypothetical protein
LALHSLGASEKYLRFGIAVAVGVEVNMRNARQLFELDCIFFIPFFLLLCIHLPSVKRTSPVVKAAIDTLREAEHRSMTPAPYWKIPGAYTFIPRQVRGIN